MKICPSFFARSNQSYEDPFAPLSEKAPSSLPPAPSCWQRIASYIHSLWIFKIPVPLKRPNPPLAIEMGIDLNAFDKHLAERIASTPVDDTFTVEDL